MSALLPLFPLHTVLVPGGTLVLRVFETRYLDMVRECGRNGSGFGVCLILAGQEAGLPATPASVGTEARIEDFGSTEAGLLTLRVRGGRRFRVLQTEVRPNGLIEAEVQWFEADPDDELRPEHALLGSVLQQVVEKVAEKVGGEYDQVPPSRFDEAAWVGWRLAELLPLSHPQRQMLLQDEDPHARLDRLLAMMP